VAGVLVFVKGLNSEQRYGSVFSHSLLSRKWAGALATVYPFAKDVYRGIWLNALFLGLYSSPMPRALWWS